MSYLEMMDRMKQAVAALKEDKSQPEPEVKQEAQEPIEAPVEEKSEAPVEVKAQEPAQPDYSESEKVAMRMGWKPKDQFYGNEHDWVDADTYIASGPVFRRTEALKKDLSKLREENQKQYELVKALVDDIKNAKEVAYKQAMADLQAQKERAVELNDYKSVKAIEDQESLLNKSHSLPEQPKQDVDHLEFIKHNPHMDLVINKKYDDPNYDKAIAIYNYQQRIIQQELDAGKNLSTKEQFELATQKAKERYGENPFEGPKRDIPPPSSSIQSIPKQNSNTSKTQKTISVSELTPSEKYIYDHLRSNPGYGMKPEEYLKNCSERRGK